MDFFELVRSRKSIRDFSSKEISQEALEQILEAAQLAPSFQNRQCWRFIVIKDRATRHRIALHSGFLGKINFFIKDAPLIVVACADPAYSGTVNRQNYYLVDVAIAFQQMMLAAWDLGIGSCWLAAFSEKKVKKTLAIPDKIRVVGISPFGYPKKKEKLYSKVVKTFAKSEKRKSLDEIIFYDKWSSEKDVK